MQIKAKWLFLSYSDTPCYLNKQTSVYFIYYYLCSCDSGISDVINVKNIFCRGDFCSSDYAYQLGKRYNISSSISKYFKVML